MSDGHETRTLVYMLRNGGCAIVLVSVEAEVDAAGITPAQVERPIRQTFGTTIAFTEQFTFARMPDFLWK